MEEINLIDLLHTILNKWYVMLISIVACLVAIIIYINFLEVPIYSSTATLILAGTSSNTITQTDLNINKNLVSTYQEVIKSKKILNQVKDDLNLSYEIDELSKMITVTSKENTDIINITVKSKDPNMSANIANDTSNVFMKEISSIYNLDNVSIIDKAESSSESSNMSNSKKILITILVAIILGFIIDFIIFMFDNSIKSKEQIESIMNLHVLGTIPYSKRYKEAK